MFPGKNRENRMVEIKWPVSALTSNRRVIGETTNIGKAGAYIRCSEPLRLNETFDINIYVPNSDRLLKAEAEVVWSNMYGPDDKATPRGMGVRFTNIAKEDQDFIAELLYEHSLENVATRYLQTLEVELGEN